MDISKAIFLGILQGLTEFLPISSSGHLLLFQRIFKLNPDISFIVYLHLGTTFSLIFFLFTLIKKEIKDRNYSLLLKIVIALIPITIIGLIFKNKIERTFSNFHILAYFFLISAFLIFFTKYVKEKFSHFNYFQALIVGLFQSLGVFPGISRSGSTIAGALYLGIKKEESFYFSFLLGLPTIIGANFLEFYKKTTLLFSLSYLLGFLFSFIFGLLALYLLKALVIKRKFYYFSYYLFFLFILLLVDNLKILRIF
ncbi:MAG: undecaprenyl-diphosphate phosphatase [candidate division WOR-3 bacterium]|nr:undecaprenyl-diphosphate phosphatase [candidate division WOR-3 bacterium]MCX7837022.1 undecaprenyl-diphosphate phosphatase [candidate division WOR-3 bacterium]MDW8114573.1 undecaprenyl-diphosphate phosphatase [candidate division WOR-3 bacterium]